MRAEAWPAVENADELHDALMLLGVVTEPKATRSGWQPQLDELIAGAPRDAADHRRRHASGCRRTAADARRPLSAGTRSIRRSMAPGRLRGARSGRAKRPCIELVRGPAAGDGAGHAAATGRRRCRCREAAIDAALLRSKAKASYCAGSSREVERRPAEPATLEWCERRLLARIHRYTIKTLRAEIEPVSRPRTSCASCSTGRASRATPRPEGVESLAAIIEQLEGYEVPAVAWESDVLAARMQRL